MFRQADKYGTMEEGSRPYPAYCALSCVDRLTATGPARLVVALSDNNEEKEPTIDTINMEKAPMGASRDIQTLRQLHTQQLAILKRYKVLLGQAASDLIPDSDKRRIIDRLQADARSEFSELRASRLQAEAAISKRKTQQWPGPTEAARTKVRQALENGFGFYDLCQQLVEEGDRQALAALDEQAPYLIKAGLVAAPSGVSSGKQVAYIRESLSQFQARMLSDREHPLYAEAQETAISSGLMESNEKVFERWCDQMPLSGGAQRPLAGPLYRWQGLPGDDTPKGTLDPLEGSEPDASGIPASWVPGLRRP
jgi:hypothetical protein